MLEHSGGGAVINITSTMGRLAGRGFAAYVLAVCRDDDLVVLIRR